MPGCRHYLGRERKTAYEAEKQHTLSAVCRLLTPFVCTGPCHEGYADHIVYLSDETLTLRVIQEKKPHETAI